MKIIDPNQFGTISNSSTTMAIISMLHKWYGDTDGTCSTIRVLLCDYRKAFDLIDHFLLVAKLKQLDFPGSVINWIISFLTGRSQRVALGNHCFSEWGRVPSGVPQGTKLGPWLFLIMINDLIVSEPFSIWKYGDDSTVSETVLKGAQSNIQLAADEVNLWSKSNLFQLNCEKTKELVITYGRSKPEDLFPPISIEEEPIGVVILRLIYLVWDKFKTIMGWSYYQTCEKGDAKVGKFKWCRCANSHFPIAKRKYMRIWNFAPKFPPSASAISTKVFENRLNTFEDVGFLLGQCTGWKLEIQILSMRKVLTLPLQI